MRNIPINGISTRINLSVSDIGRNHVSRVLSFGTATAEEGKGEEKQKRVSVIFSRPAKIPSFFPSHLLRGQRASVLRDINYIFQKWMQFRNKNPLNMSCGWQFLIPSPEKRYGRFLRDWHVPFPALPHALFFNSHFFCFFAQL